MLPASGRPGADSWTIFSQQRHDFFSLAISMTLSWAVIMSSISLTSSPTRRSAPPQSGQSVPGSSSQRSRGVFAETRGRRRGLRPGVSLALPGAAFSSGTAPTSAAAINRSSSASSSCSISRATFSKRFAEHLLLELGDAQLQALDQLVTDPQGRGQLGVPGLQRGHHRLQGDGIIREQIGQRRHGL